MNILPLHFYVNKVILYSMIKSKGDSGQSVVIGALLLLALFVAFISWFQITQVPILNQNAEAENNEMIRTEMFEFQEKSYDSILNDNVNQISFQTKVDYDYQISGFQDKIGQFSVTEFNDKPINVTGANKTNTNISGLPSRMISLKYTPPYIERTEIPFIYENGILIENQTTTRLDKGGQRFIRGNNIYMFEFETNFVALQSPRIVFVTVSDRDLQETIITGVDEDANKTNITGLPSSMISLKYTPSYIERTEIPFIYENGILIENQKTTRLDTGGQRFIRGNNIYMFEFETNFVALQSPRIVFFTVPVPEIDLQETIITGANDGNGKQNITIELDTNLSVDIWERLLDNQDHVKKVSDTGGSIKITLNGTEEYKVYTGKAIIEQ